MPVPELSNQPEDEMRNATLVVGTESVAVHYRHFYGTGVVDLIAVLSG